MGFSIRVPDIVSRFRIDTEEGFSDAEKESKEGGKRVGKAMGVGLASAAVAVAAAAALVAKAAGDAMEREASNFKLKAQLGLSPAEAKRYGKVSGALFNDGYAESIGDLNTTIAGAVRNIPGLAQANNKVVKTTVGQLSSMTDAFEQDAQGLSAAIGQMLRTGMAKNAQQAMNILTRGFQSGANKADDLLDTFNEYGTQARKLGLDGKKFMGLLSQGVNAGARDSDVAADALKEFSIRSVEASKGSRAAYAAIGLDARAMEEVFSKGGPRAAAALDEVLDRFRAMPASTKKTAALFGLFGTQSEDLGGALDAMDPSKAVNALGRVGGAAKQVDKDMAAGLGASLTRFKREAQSKLIDLIQFRVLPTLTRWVEAIKPVYREARRLAGVFGGKAFAALKDFASTVGAELAPVFKDYANTVKTDVLPVLKTLGNEFATKVTPILARVGGMFTGSILPILKTVASIITGTVIPAVWPFIRIIGTNLIGAVTGFAKAYYDKVAPALKRLKDTIMENRPQIQALAAGVARFAGAILVAASWVAKKLAPVLGKFAGFMAGTLIDVIGAAIKIIGGIVRAVQSFAKWAADASLAVERFVAKVKDKFNTFKTKVGNAFNSVIETGGTVIQWFQDLPGVIWDAIKGLWDGDQSLYQGAVDMIDGFVQGLKDKAGDIVKAVKENVTDKIPGPIRKALDIHSPSRVMRTIGRHTSDGMALGMSDRVRAISAASRRMAVTAVSAVDGLSVPAPRMQPAYAGAPGGMGSRHTEHHYHFQETLTGDRMDNLRSARALAKTTERI